MASDELKVDFTGLNGVQQGLANTGASVVTAVTQAQPAITTGSDAHPAWLTSAVNQQLFATHGDALVHWTGNHISPLVGGVYDAGVTYSSNETQTKGDIAAILNQGS
jgi:hypothetical protein